MSVDKYYKVKTLDELKEIILNPQEKFEAFYALGASKNPKHAELFKEMICLDFVNVDDLYRYGIDLGEINFDFQEESKKIINQTIKVHNLMNEIKYNPKGFQKQAISKRKSELAKILYDEPHKSVVEKIVELLTPTYLIRHFGEMGENLKNYPNCVKSYFEIKTLNDGNYSIVSEKRSRIKSWENATTPWAALDLIPEGKEWDAFEYYLEHNPKLARSFAHHTAMFAVPKIYRRYKDVDLSKLPLQTQQTLDLILKAYKERLQREFQAKNFVLDFDDKKEIHSHVFCDEYGNLKQFFNFNNNLHISTFDEYILLTNQFLESNLSLESFCKKYRISSESGFKAMLDAIMQEDEKYKDLIKEKLESGQKSFFSKSMELMRKISEPNSDVGELINDNKSDKRNLSFYLNLNDNLVSYGEKLNFVRNLIMYYGKKLGLNDSSASVENINNMLTEKEIAFLVDEETLMKMKKGAKIDLLDVVRDEIAIYRVQLDKEIENKELRQALRNFSAGLPRYSNRFIRKRYLAVSPGVGDKDGNLVSVNEEVVDMAMHYAKTKKLYPCYYAMERIIKAIINGEIENRSDTIKAMSQMRRQIFNEINACSNIEEYINKIDSFTSSK